MKALIKLSKLTLLAVVFIFASCSDDDDNGPTTPTPTLNIVETADAENDLSSLVGALKKADESADNDLVSALSGDGPFTVFAPTNAAFDDLFKQLGDFDGLDDFNTQELQNVLAVVLSYHVISGTAALSSDLSDGQVLTTLQTGTLTISTEGGVFIDDATDVNAEVTTADVETTNGVVHIIDKVLLPQEVIDQLRILITITDLASGNENLESLVAALLAADEDLDEVLKGDGPFTVLAPSDEAFAEFLGEDELADIPVETLTNVLKNHVISGALLQVDLEAAGSGYANTLATREDDNISIYYNTTDGVVFNGVSTVETADVEALNGIVHIVDKVIDLPTVVTFATADPTFESLVAALTTDGQPDFVSTLGGDGPFTVFAPTNDAFQALLDSNDMWDGLTDIDSGLLTSVLEHHVIADVNIRSTDLTENGVTVTPATLEGDTFSITLPGTNGNIADVTDGAGNTGIGIDAVDVQAANGVIHVLDAVLIPDTEN
ncbi:fasciclin domain-containing protein [Flagellimonas sp. 389]|uniref:fasciclin domain-containing protein n=1 Tax=Flagellimonas sp. 389 TaxID=2835862 RepID=UPI001BD6312B|nr:fasciclin domain-containing protein [Flagellimonas sp. 389]MBS9463746.1 fasciclin domain-containing protein [Flagellimonas sp. 389]